DFNFDGDPDQAFTGTDTDNDGLDDGYEGADVDDGYDVNDEIDDPASDLPDTDGTEDVNYRDFDDDGDGIDTPDEDADGDGDPTDDDTDGDGTPDYLDDTDDTETVAVEVNQLVTPNGDGKNDFLFIRGVENARNNTLQIFNRWGVAVYEGRNYNNINNIFDGRSRGRSTLSVDDYLPSGVYFYIFEYDTDQGRITDSDYFYISR
ncbi:gliding motility-associated C-terminal domain-containing protein, partial [Allomuricauda sp. d1]|uniref:gliding motility-associated C-terminal domain-containing protein n=1 Tax=Allomuricauda sp. d1 TaxID=3136725 RepID=UPI0031D29278